MSTYIDFFYEEVQTGVEAIEKEYLDLDWSVIKFDASTLLTTFPKTPLWVPQKTPARICMRAGVYPL